METELKQQFAGAWSRYFPGAELPLGVFYGGEPGDAECTAAAGRPCLIDRLADVRAGRPLAFDKGAIGCSGGKRYLGFVPDLRPRFEYFLSCGIPGEMEGERYKKSPELVREMLKNTARFEAPARYIVFKRWDQLGEGDQPAIVIFFATPDVLSGLFTLVGYDDPQPQAVITPFGAGCSSIVYHPYQELQSENPRAVLGMFDVSARPHVPANTLTMSIPWPRFVGMIGNMDECFLITESWRKVKVRIAS